MKAVRLRAFKIANSDINNQHPNLNENLSSKLKDSTSVNDRRMPLNPEDPQKEEDLISYFQCLSNSVFCTMLRIKLGNNIQHINTELFNKKSFTISELKESTVDGEAIYKNNYYFSVSNKFLITNLQLNRSIKKLETYLGWLLNGLYEINPIIDKEFVPSLSQITDIEVKGSDINLSSIVNPSDNLSTETKVTTIAKNTFLHLFKFLDDSKKLNDIKIEQMISAKLIIKIRKPRKNDNEELKKAYAALLKPVADLENYTFHTKGKTKIKKGQDILRTKDVKIETTDSGFLNESQLSQEMDRFLLELENES